MEGPSTSSSGREDANHSAFQSGGVEVLSNTAGVRRVLGTPSSKGSRKRAREAGADDPSSKKVHRWLCQRPCLAAKNSFRKLMMRELCPGGNLGFSRHTARDRFASMKVAQEYDTYDQRGFPLRINQVPKRTRIVEIVAAKGLVFALGHTGLCAVFGRVSNSFVCYMNTSEDEVVRSLFYNKNNDALITVSVYAYDNYSSLRCRSTPLEYVRRGKPSEGFPLFESESLKWPGFVEFDDVNAKILTYNAQHHVYKVYGLKNYDFLYKISDLNIHEIKISPGIMLLISEFNSPSASKQHGASSTPAQLGQPHQSQWGGERERGLGPKVPLQILNVETGAVLKSFEHALTPNRGVEFVEQFNEKLLVKQEHEDLLIVDVCTGKHITVPSTNFTTPSAFIFLYENQLFLTFRKSKVEVWNFKGQLVTSFEDHQLWHPDGNTNNIYITSEQDLIVSYCRPNESTREGAGDLERDRERARGRDGGDERGGDGEGVGGEDQRKGGSINVSNILTGKCIAKLRNDSTSRGASPLENVTALFYDEESNEIYTGSRSGIVHVWSCGK